MFAVIFILALETLGAICFLLIFFPSPNSDQASSLAYGLAVPILFISGILITSMSTIGGLIVGVVGNKKHPELKRYKILFRTSYIVLIVAMIGLSIAFFVL